jgi:pimeloyl-ACP methyl ester carboxylesterase
MILWIPGMLNTAQIWDEVIDTAVALGIPRAAMEVADVTQDTSIAAMAQRAWSQFGLSGSEPNLVVGFSLGGYVAIEMVARPPAEAPALQGLVLVGTTASPEPVDNLSNRQRAIAALGKDFAKTVHGIASWGMHEPSEALLAHCKAAMLPVGAEVAIAQTQAIMARADHREALRRVHLPASIVHGEQDRIVDPKGSRELAELLPRSRRVGLPSCGHMVPKEKSAELAYAVFELYQQITDPVTSGRPS